MDSAQTSWKKFRAELSRRLKEPAHATFVGYFFVVIIFVGGLGVWFPRVYDICAGKTVVWTSVPQDLFTYYAAILATASVNVLLQSTSSKAMRMLYIGIWIFAVIVGILIFPNPSSFFSMCISIVGTIMAWFIWWISNADNDLILDNEPLDALAGDGSSSLSGNLKNIKS